jgi:hypothetical protein
VQGILALNSSNALVVANSQIPSRSDGVTAFTVRADPIGASRLMSTKTSTRTASRGLKKVVCPLSEGFPLFEDQVQAPGSTGDA